MNKLAIQTSRRTEFLDITGDVQRFVTESGIQDGICTVFVPHTTAGITINENADPDVIADMGAALDKLVPWQANYRHNEGNSAAHVKSSLLGHSVQVFVKAGLLQLGTWQGIYFCEFDGPRIRTAWVNIGTQNCSCSTK